jgi:hypothetical protein
VITESKSGNVRTSSAGVGRRITDDRTTVHHAVHSTETDVVLDDRVGLKRVVGRSESQITDVDGRQVLSTRMVKRAWDTTRRVYEALSVVGTEGS